MALAIQPRPSHADHVSRPFTESQNSVDQNQMRETVLKRTNETFSNVARRLENDEVEDMDDDREDFSDHDSHYSEDLDDEILELQFRQSSQKNIDITKQLLNFSDMINNDIKKFFGRRKGEDDYCDIYEDKWLPMKSGRELYYADLLRIAQGEGDCIRGSSDSRHVQAKHLLDNRDTFSGKTNEKLGLGPLSDLFEYGLRHYLFDQEQSEKRLKQLNVELKKRDAIVPMHNRTFPESFWKEPGMVVKDRRSEKGVSSLLNASKALDFSDLLQSWTGGDHQPFSGELSSNALSPNTVIHAL